MNVLHTTTHISRLFPLPTVFLLVNECSFVSKMIKGATAGATAWSFLCVLMFLHVDDTCCRVCPERWLVCIEA